MEFISLLSRMLTLDPSQRITPSAALQMPFITMQHLAMHIHTPVVWDWIQSMQVCKHTSSSCTSSFTSSHQKHQHQATVGATQASSHPTTSSNCCSQLHLLTAAGNPATGTATAVQPTPLFYPVIPQTHLVSN